MHTYTHTYLHAHTPTPAYEPIYYIIFSGTCKSNKLFLTFEYNYLLTQPHYLFIVLTQMVLRQRPVLFIINKTLIAPPLKFTLNQIIFNHNISVKVINIC